VRYNNNIWNKCSEIIVTGIIVRQISSTLSGALKGEKLMGPSRKDMEICHALLGEVDWSRVRMAEPLKAAVTVT